MEVIRLERLRAAVGATDYRDRMVAEAVCILAVPAVKWRWMWQSLSPPSVGQFLEDLHESSRFYDLRKCWWKWAGTNNPLGRLIRTLRQGLSMLGCLHDEPAIKRAVFGQLFRWPKSKLTHNN